MKDLISIIVPVYKVEKYLKKCIDSIINQTYKNLEIFLVDDGSPDSCGQICDEYATRDSRIKVIHKENGGLSDARNVAIDVCNGKYVTFIDSDDYVSIDFIEYMYNNAITNNSEISTCGYIPFYEEVNSISEEEIINTYDNKKALELMMYQRGITTSAWGKLYLTSLFSNVRYPKGKICEDLDTTYKLFLNALNVTVSNKKLYFYLQRRDSIINSKFSLKRMDALYFAIEMEKVIDQNCHNIILSAKNRLFMEAIFIIIKIPNKQYKDAKSILLKIIKQNRFEVIKDKKSRIEYRLIALLSYLGIWLVKLSLILKNSFSRMGK